MLDEQRRFCRTVAVAVLICAAVAVTAVLAFRAITKVLTS